MDTDSSSDDPLPLRFRFNTRSLLALMTVVCVLLALWPTLAWLIFWQCLILLLVFSFLLLMQAPLYWLLKKLRPPAESSQQDDPEC